MGSIKPPDDEGPSNILEGVFLKQNRNRQWKERYFVFGSDQIISYYHRKGDSQAKSALVVSREVGCDISELYVEERQKGNLKETLYCMMLTWPDDNSNRQITGGDDMSYLDEAHHDSFSGHNLTFSPARSPARPVMVPIKSAPNSSHRRAHTLASSAEPFIPTDYELEISSTKRRTSRFRRSQSAGGRDSADSSFASGSQKRKHKRKKSWFRKSPGSGEFAIPGEVSAIGPPPLESGGSDDGAVALAPRITDPSMEAYPTSSDDGLGESEQGDDSELHAAVKQTQKSYEEQHAAEQTHLQDKYVSSKKEKSKRSRKRIVGGTKLAVAAGAAVGVGVVTAGVGLAAGLVVLGITFAAGGTAGVAEVTYNRQKGRRNKLIIGTTDFETAKLWRSTLQACLDGDLIRQSTWGQLFVAEGRKTTTALLSRDVELINKKREGRPSPLSAGDEARPAFFLKERQFQEEATASWQPLEGGWTSLLGSGASGLRIFQEEKIGLHRRLAIQGDKCPPLKAQIVVNAAPLDTFMCLMSYSRIRNADAKHIRPNPGQRISFDVVEKIDDHMDIVHIVYRELYLFPSWTSPRDFVVCRYWRYEPDGSYIVCYESVEHPKCPVRPEYVRGQMHQVYTVAPAKRTGKKASQAGVESLLTSVTQIDPAGWVPTTPLGVFWSQSYADAFGVFTLLQLLDIRDAIDFDRFIDVSADMQQSVYRADAVEKRVGELPQSEEHRMATTDDMMNYDSRFANRERTESLNLESIRGIELNPPPLSMETWAEPDANSFVVRGRSYMKDKVKINAGSSIGQLIATDVVWVDKPIYSGMSTHPTERIQLGLAREKKLLASGKKGGMPPFVFVVNIILPGPPFFHGVFYYAVDDMSTIDGSDGTGSSNLANKFLFGDDDGFRDRTFKLIPHIVEGNFLVRKAVGSTPAIMGTKLKQTYVRNDRFMEVILDCGSSQVATGVIRLSLGYAKTLVIDMGFLLEGDDESTLPERIFGCVRMKYPEFSHRLRKVEQPPTGS